MTNHTENLAKGARDCREAAKRAREFVDRIGSDMDGMYLRFAEKQERRAAELEAAMRSAPPDQVAFEQSNSSSRAEIVQGRTGPPETEERPKESRDGSGPPVETQMDITSLCVATAGARSRQR